MAKQKPLLIHLDDQALNIFTDGSSFSSPRMGGYGIRFLSVDEAGDPIEYDYSPIGHRGATNNEMELKAVIEALVVAMSRDFFVDLTAKTKIVVYTDSQYVAGNFDNAKYQWPKTRWMTRDGNPVIHAELWKDLIKRVQQTSMRVEIVWQKGHSTSNPHNKAADKLAKASAANATKPPLAIVKVRRKSTTAREERGSVHLSGQRMTIKIITDRYLRTTRLYMYKYEVASTSNPYYGKVDQIFSEHLMSAGHTYSVRVNDITSTPRVLKVFREITKD